MTTKTDTPDDIAAAEKLERLNANLAKMDELSKRLVAAMGKKKSADPGLQAPGQEVYMQAAAAYMAEMMNNPSKILEQQVSYWGKSLKHYVDAQQPFVHGKIAAPEDKGPTDRRFKSELWDTHPYFNFIKQQYMYSSAAITDAMQNLEGLSDHEKGRVSFFAQQIVDMFAPTNFLATNPEALSKAVETDGASLVQGLENLVHDIEANEGDLLVSLADETAFKVGENIAATEGSVVFRNHMFELIQYKPTTENVHATPIVIFPPWINKFYVMDLKPQNSLIKWVVDQGHTLFIVSWVNPDESYADVGIDTYVDDGYLTAFEQVKKITGQKQLNAVGYCIAGTTLSLVLALMKKRGDKTVKSATFFTMLSDFEDPGEMGVFLEDDFVDGIERQVAEKGFLHSFFMSRTFSYLRANDLVYGPAIRSYMLGEAPPAFDLLYWNGDSTNLPGRFVVEYLRELCQGNKLAKGTMELLGETLSLADIELPICAIACETDHIAAWRGSYAGIKQFGSEDKTFIVSESGHVAGIINPPSKKKYGHYTNKDMSGTQDDWWAGATFNEGSWWPRWDAWLAEKSSKMVPAREPGSEQFPILGPAPGTYVQVKSNKG
ncbi:polyhydroxyalkanoate synthase [Litoreibacter ascidiaceicola]|uniref:Polyhydroxyalkanoate synthase n=1 Tax=Litoreibacter ascidiaceicola TaxID=1486859 RepID=A0A1M4TF72_9RHOB|nr:class I poly(R)-hydroxyalkanoic acid synthase [Litoreibacter ascidiaceicola]SHE43103.1 polyhydroxyalkanoate synthase [Litoreibacter ascidiaceicola]